MPWPKHNKNNRESYKPRWEASLSTLRYSVSYYMGTRAGATTRAKTSTSTLRAPARSRTLVHASTVSPDNVVDKDKPLTMNRGLAGRRYGECALDVHGSRAARQTDLLGCGAHASERRGEKRDSGICGHHLCECRSLIEPPPPQPSPVQRHRHQRIRVIEQRPAGARHPLTHGSGEVEPVAIFESVDKVAGDVIVAYGGARPSIGRWISDRLHGQNSRTWIIGEWNAEAFAVRWRNERHARPARRTQPA